MEQKNIGNDYNLQATWQFFKRWKTLLIVVTIVAFVVSLVASLLVPPRYKATAILFPTSSNRLSKAILAERYSMDFLDYGSERDCEYAIQILTSQSMEDAVVSRFNMTEHYGIPMDDPHKMFKTHEMYRSYVSVKRTEYLGVEISVLDRDPQWAADIANFIAAHYDTLSYQIQNARARNSYAIMRDVSNAIQADIFAYEDSLRMYPAHAASLRELISHKTKELAEIQTRMSETQVDLNHQVSYKYWLDKAAPADKKATPKRSIIVLLGTLGALAMCILTLLVAGRICGNDDNPHTPRKKEHNRGENRRQNRKNQEERTGKGKQSKGNNGGDAKREGGDEERNRRNARRNNGDNADRREARQERENRENDSRNSHAEQAREVENFFRDARPRTDIAPNPPEPRMPKAPYNGAPSF